MASKKEILIATDFSNESNSGVTRSHQLIDLGTKLAKRLKMNLKILYAIDVPKKFFPTKETLLGPGSDWIKQLSTEAKVEIMNGKPAEMILKSERSKNDVEMLVQGTRGNRGLKAALLGSVSEEVLRNSKHPVVVLGPQALSEKFKLKASGKLKLLVVTDLTEASGPAERYALQLAKKLPADIVLAHSVGDSIRRLKDMVSTQRIVSPKADAFLEEIKEHAEESMARKMKSLSGQTAVKVTPYLSYEEKDVVKVLQQQNWQDCDLIVMGSHSRSRLLKVFLGSTARRMILNAPVPVIVIRS
ncbi:universal stress protein [Bdellovibrio sp. HCB290]|uniref:universal stress protein n=1 Tax=Bdellovibrio sp. HCB290 TaxID=3394356 RepID=UPI0039B3F305